MAPPSWAADIGCIYKALDGFIALLSTEPRRIHVEPPMQATTRAELRVEKPFYPSIMVNIASNTSLARWEYQLAREQIHDSFEAGWKGLTTRRVQALKNNLHGVLLRVALHMSRSEDIPEPDSAVVRTALKLLESYHFLAQPWAFSGVPPHCPFPSPLSVYPLDRLTINALITPICAELSGRLQSCVEEGPMRATTQLAIFMVTYLVLYTIDQITLHDNGCYTSPWVSMTHPDPYKIASLQVAAKALLCCHHGSCNQHAHIVSDLYGMVSDAQQGGLQERIAAQLYEVVMYTNEQDWQCWIQGVQNSRDYVTPVSYWALQIFRKGWRPLDEP